MRNKIEITNEETPERESEADAPEFGDHVNPAEPARAGAEDGSASAVAELQQKLQEAEKRAEDAEKSLRYQLAEFQNYRRRRDEEAKELQKFSNGELVRGLLPVVDNFERALAAAEQTRNFDALIGGVAGTLKQMQAFLQKAGVTPIEAIGKEFDPNFHEAIGHTESDAPANTVTEEVQRGYLMHERVLRPTLVRVSQG